MAKPTTMSIIAHICDDVKDYKKNGLEKVKRMVAEEQFRCHVCCRPLHIHSYYRRKVKETGDTLTIAVLRCGDRCERGKALLPDFISQYRQYSMNEIEKVVSGKADGRRVSEIDTKASESTASRWISQTAERIIAAISVVKAVFVEMGAAVSELRLDRRGGFAELESLLDAAPKRSRHSGTTLGLANLWLGMRPPPAYI